MSFEVDVSNKISANKDNLSTVEDDNNTLVITNTSQYENESENHALIVDDVDDC